MSEFAGFPDDAWAFLAELEADNTRAFFDAHRKRYEACLAVPARALVEELGITLPALVDLDVRAEAKVGRSLFRINRDTRFAADKTPYKTYLDLLFWVGDGAPRERPAFITRITASTVLVGGGHMGLAGPALDAYRRAVDDEDRATPLGLAVDRLVAAGADLSEADRARVPRPYPADHPRAELLRRDGFHLSRTVPHPGELGMAAFSAWCGAALAPFAPVVAWLASVAS